jgi:hydroxymethylpyrimidine pyrophosphatase-like HAD family hydrolase
MVKANNNATEAKNAPQHIGWIGVDLDGTLARYDGWKGSEHIGEPIPEMVRKVKEMLADGCEVRIFTARVYPHWWAASGTLDEESVQIPDSPARIAHLIREWCRTHIGQVLDVTCRKDFGMIMLYDDRCTYVFPNQGITHKEHQGFLQAAFLEVATVLGVSVRDGANFKEVADECAMRARAGVADRAKAYADVLALFDGAEDALRFALKPSSMGQLVRGDLERTLANLQRALPMLRELAGRKG